MLSHNKQVKIIREAYRELQAIGLQDGFRNVEQVLYTKNLIAERQHRKGAPEGITHGLGVIDAAKLFTVSHLLDGFANPDKWSVDDILNIRTEVLYAQAYAKRFRKELTEWASKYTKVFKQIDYAELQSHGRS